MQSTLTTTLASTARLDFAARRARKMTPTVPDDDDDDDAAVEEVSTDGRDVTDVSEVAGQLAGATSAIADQLSMITEEMNKLRSELYSDNGLGSIRQELDALRSGGLEQIQQQVEQIAASADTTSSSGARARPAAASSSRARAAQERADEEGRADAPQARRVSFDRDTRDVARRHGAGKVATPRLGLGLGLAIPWLGLALGLELGLAIPWLGLGLGLANPW